MRDIRIILQSKSVFAHVSKCKVSKKCIKKRGNRSLGLVLSKKASKEYEVVKENEAQYGRLRVA